MCFVSVILAFQRTQTSQKCHPLKKKKRQQPSVDRNISAHINCVIRAALLEQCRIRQHLKQHTQTTANGLKHHIEKSVDCCFLCTWPKAWIQK